MAAGDMEGGLGDASIPYTPRGESLTEQVQRHDLLLNGDPRRDVLGIRKRLSNIEAWMLEQKNMQLMVRGLLIGLGANLLLSLVTIAKLMGWLP